MGFALTTTMMRSLVGRHPSVDSAVRNLIRLQQRDTGADIFSPALDRNVSVWLQSGLDTRILCERIIEVVFPQIRIDRSEEDGAVLAPPPTFADFKGGYTTSDSWCGIGGSGYMKQGHAACIAIFAGYTNQPWSLDLGARIAAWIERQQERRLMFAVRGLWTAGAVNGSWTGQWAYTTETIPFEDGTQAFNTVCMAAFDRTNAVALAVKGIAQVAALNSGLIPYNASRRSGLVDFGRIPVLFSTEEMARVVMLLEDMDPIGTKDTVALIRARLGELEIKSGGGAPAPARTWPKFVDEWGAQVWPRADVTDPSRMRAQGNGEITRTRSESMLGGFDGNTSYPQLALAG